MNILLDTHTLIWWSLETHKLSISARSLLEDVENNLFVSVVSIWEMQIKNQMGKLTLIMPLPEIIESQKETNNLQILPLELSHIYTLKDLPYYHRDPFDRILIAQAVFEKMPLLSIDEIIDAYSVQRIW